MQMALIRLQPLLGTHDGWEWEGCALSVQGVYAKISWGGGAV